MEIDHVFDQRYPRVAALELVLACVACLIVTQSALADITILGVSTGTQKSGFPYDSTFVAPGQFTSSVAIGNRQFSNFASADVNLATLTGNGFDLVHAAIVGSGELNG